WFFWVAPWIIVLRGLATGDGVTSVVGSLQVSAGLAVMRLQSRTWGSALRDMIAMPAACVLFLAMAGVGRARGWWRGGSMWKGRVIPTAQHLPPWHPQPPRARRQAQGRRRRRAWGAPPGGPSPAN